MALIVADTYQLSVNGHQEDRPWTNVFHAMPSGSPALTAEEAAEAMFVAYTENISSVQCTIVQTESVSYVDLSSSTGDSGTYVPADPVPGDNDSASVSPAVSVLVHWAATGGRAYRNGRSYIPGIQEASVDGGGDIDGSSLAGWSSKLTAFWEDLDAAGLILCVVSRTSPSAGIARTITGVSVDGRVATQRRRQR